uniref:Reverse transcriptase domain-containing protein n=1 Tax=Ascaris lumbricoides TaxID=6252 RepID=A0A0M3I0R5_ASCLU
MWMAQVSGAQMPLVQMSPYTSRLDISIDYKTRLIDKVLYASYIHPWLPASASIISTRPVQGSKCGKTSAEECDDFQPNEKHLNLGAENSRIVIVLIAVQSNDAPSALSNLLIQGGDFNEEFCTQACQQLRGSVGTHDEAGHRVHDIEQHKGNSSRIARMKLIVTLEWSANIAALVTKTPEEDLYTLKRYSHSTKLAMVLTTIGATCNTNGAHSSKMNNTILQSHGVKCELSVLGNSVSEVIFGATCNRPYFCHPQSCTRRSHVRLHCTHRGRCGLHWQAFIHRSQYLLIGEEGSESYLEESGADRSRLSSSNDEQIVSASTSSSSDAISQSLVEAKKDSTLFESLDEDIVLDTNTLQSIATDLSQGGAAVDKSLIGEDMARQLTEIEKAKETEATGNTAEMQQLCEEERLRSEKLFNAVLHRYALQQFHLTDIEPTYADIIAKISQAERIATTAMQKTSPPTDEIKEPFEAGRTMKRNTIFWANFEFCVVNWKAFLKNKDFYREKKVPVGLKRKLLEKSMMSTVLCGSEVLATLDTALDKILRRAPEFYDNKEELDAFLRDPVNAKAQLLDALIAKKSSFLVDLMGDASFYANMISQGIVDAYQLATKGVLVVCGNLNAAQAAVLQGCEYSKQMASRGINLTYDAARKGTELLSSGVNTTLSAASVSAEMLAKSATYAADTGMNAIGQSLTMSKNAAAKGAEFTYNAATIGKNAMIRSGVSGTMAVASTSATLLTRTASEATLAAVKTGQTVNEVVGQGVGYSKEIACKGAGLTYDAAAAGGALLASGASIATQSAGTVAHKTVEAGKMVSQGLSSAVTSTQHGLEATKDVLSSAGMNLMKTGSWISSFLTVPSTSESAPTADKTAENATDQISVASDNKQKKTDSQQPTNAAVLNKSNLDGNNMIKVVEQPSTANDKCECKIYTGLESVNSVMCLLGMQHTNTLCYLKYRRPYNIGHRFIDIFYSLK